MNKKIKSIQDKSSQQQQFDVYQKSLDSPVSKGKFLSELDQWKYDLKYKGTDQKDLRQATLNHNKNLQQNNNNMGPSVSKDLMNIIVNDQFQQKQQKSEQSIDLNDTEQTNKQLQQQGLSNPYSIFNTNQKKKITPANFSSQVASFTPKQYIVTSPSNGEQTKSKQIILTQEESQEQYMKKSRQSTKSKIGGDQQQEQQTTLPYYHREVNRNLLNNMLMERVKKQIDKEQQKIEQSQTQMLDELQQQNNSNQNQSKSVSMSLSKKQQEQQNVKFLQNVFQKESSHFQQDVLSSFVGLYKHFAKPSQVIQSKKLVPQLEQLFQGPKGLKKISDMDSSTEQQLSKNHQVDQDKFFKNMERMLLESFCNNSVKLKEISERIVKYKSKNVKIGINIQNLKARQESAEKTLSEKLFECEQEKYRVIKESRGKNKNLAELQYEEEVLKLESQHESLLEKFQLKKEFYQSDWDQNESIIKNLQEEYTENKDKKNLTRVALNDLYHEMLKSSQFSQESLVWVVKSLMRIEEDITTAKIYPQYLDQESIQFLQDFAQQQLILEELKDQQQMNTKKNKSLHINIKETSCDEAIQMAKSKLSTVTKNKTAIVKKPVFHLNSKKSTEHFVNFEKQDATQILEEIHKEKPTINYPINSEQQTFFKHQQVLRNQMNKIQTEMDRLKDIEIDRLFNLYKNCQSIHKLQNFQHILKDLFGVVEGQQYYKQFLKKRLEYNSIKQKNKTFVFSSHNNKQQDKIMEQQLLEKVDETGSSKNITINKNNYTSQDEIDDTSYLQVKTEVSYVNNNNFSKNSKTQNFMSPRIGGSTQQSFMNYSINSNLNNKNRHLRNISDLQKKNASILSATNLETQKEQEIKSFYSQFNIQSQNELNYHFPQTQKNKSLQKRTFSQTQTSFQIRKSIPKQSSQQNITTVNNQFLQQQQNQQQKQQSLQQFQKPDLLIKINEPQDNQKNMCLKDISPINQLSDSQEGIIGNKEDYYLGINFMDSQVLGNFIQYGTIQHWLFQWSILIISVFIISGSCMERVQIFGFSIYLLVFSMVIYPVQLHWTLKQKNQDDNIDGWLAKYEFMDSSGLTVISLISGTVCLILKQNENEINSSPLLLCGQIFLVISFNQLISYSLSFKLNDQILLNLSQINQILSSFMSGLVAIILTKISKQKRYNYDLIIKQMVLAMVSGIIAVSGCSHKIENWGAISIGFIAGILHILFSHFIKVWKLNDSQDSIVIFFFNGIWGILSTGIFINDENGKNGLIYGGSQIGIQSLVILILISFTGIISFVIFKIMAIDKINVLILNEDLQEKGCDNIINDENEENNDIINDFLQDMYKTKGQNLNSILSQKQKDLFIEQIDKIKDHLQEVKGNKEHKEQIQEHNLHIEMRNKIKQKKQQLQIQKVTQKKLQEL